jgi:hypothetical protein
MPDDRLKLSCTHGSFSTLLGSASIQTVYTDYGGTSRTSMCNPTDLLDFAYSVIDFYSPDDSMEVQIAGE